MYRDNDQYIGGWTRGKTTMRRNRRRNPELEARIEKTIVDGSGLSEWEQSFLNSLKEGVKRYGSLTGKQEQTLQRIERSRDPAVQKARKAWYGSFTEAMRKKMIIAAKYYINNPPYFADLAHRICDDDSFVPTEKQYRSMVENKYVLKVLDNMNTVPTFTVGSMAKIRSTANDTSLRQYRNKMVMIIDYPEKVAGAARGAIPVVVLPIGAAETIETEVRWLKRAKV